MWTHFVFVNTVIKSVHFSHSDYEQGLPVSHFGVPETLCRTWHLMNVCWRGWFVNPRELRAEREIITGGGGSSFNCCPSPLG
jgi:hypothetical protein